MAFALCLVWTGFLGCPQTLPNIPRKNGWQSQNFICANLCVAFEIISCLAAGNCWLIFEGYADAYWFDLDWFFWPYVGRLNFYFLVIYGLGRRSLSIGIGRVFWIKIIYLSRPQCFQNWIITYLRQVCEFAKKNKEFVRFCQYVMSVMTIIFIASEKL